ncbi:unnamed protein product [Schistosoma curassoni]|uniref:HECW1_helix domain-containing protein n=1 Tax=Schistosoma curassoni TaxID=6186 RepID=A0A183JSY9_9TREM|nr:unnamed protein product [Schistosoma curassoni]
MIGKPDHHVMKIISSSQTVGSFDRNQQGDNYAQLDVISDNHDVLKWDYAGDIASNHLGVPRIISHSSLSCHPVNYVDYGNYDVNMTMTWPSSSPHISPSSGYGYAVRRKYNFNTRNNSNRNWNESSKIKGFKTWPSKVEDTRELRIFDQRCFGNIAHICWDHRVS